MTFSILISPTRGFWSDEDGWVTHCTEASKLPVDSTIQINFIGIRDVFRVHSKKVSLLDVSQIVDWLNLNLKHLVSNIEDINSVESIIKYVNKNSDYILMASGEKGISVVDTTDKLKLEKAPLISPFLRKM